MRSLLILLGLLVSACSTVSKPETGLGIMVGDVSENRAFIQVRVNEAQSHKGKLAVVKFILKPLHDAGKEIVQDVKALPQNDFIARANFKNLKSHTKYICNTIVYTNESKSPGPIARFKTLAGMQSAEVNFAVVTGMNYAKFHGDDRIDREQHLRENRTHLPKPYSGIDKHLGYPALETMLNFRPDFFVGTGDNVYYDTPDNPRAETVPELRLKWHEQFSQQRFKDLFAEVPTYWEIDDHDYRIDDGDNSGDHLPTPETARKMMLEQLPVAAHGDDQAKTYRTYRVSKELQVWFVENRMYRSNNNEKDGPNKTIWGKPQKEWLKKTLLASDAKFKILISPTPMIGPDGDTKTDNHCNINGFQYERDEFFDWLNKTGLSKKGFYIVCGDRHWQYHSISPKGIEEFSSGAICDVNSRLGVKPGTPNSTDPKGTVKQVYTQTVRSGGFLMVNSLPAKAGGAAKLIFKFYDEKGVLIHSHSKESK